ncbi:MAG: hypothetical protein M1837_004409 [Sclerophora amabilis]|nr:MAG: hypothetical protein M1837_004409 [Sclerophora amabilis]
MSLKDLRDDYDLPALGVGKSTSTGHFTSQVAGVRKEGETVPALRTDQFHLGSNTKAMTATVLALMIEDGIGNLSWTTALSDALPAFSNISEANRNVTLEMLTSHRSGFFDERAANEADYRISLLTQPAIEGRRTIAERILSEPPAKAQGTYTYDNVNYVIAGIVIDVAANMSVEEVITRRLFEPLGMSTAGFGPVPERSNTSIDNPWPHTASLSGPTPVEEPLLRRDNPPAYGPAGRAYCTMADYDKFLRLHLDGMHGRINSSSAFNLSTAGFRHLHTAYSDPEVAYTYGGWLRTNLTGEDNYKLSHDGSNTMNFATAEIYTGTDEAYIAVTNAGSSTEVTEFSAALHSVINQTIHGTLLAY